MNSNVQEIRNRLEQAKGSAKQLEKDFKATHREVKRTQIALNNWKEALEIIKIVGIKTQKELEYHIGNLVSLAISSVFPHENYKFTLEFVERRGQSECDLYLEQDGKVLDPIYGNGGGIVDIACFALRIAALSMLKGKIRPLLILDEPFKHLSDDLQEPAGEMLSKLSNKVGIQIIYISHTQKTIESADTIITTKKEFGKSKAFITYNNKES